MNGILPFVQPLAALADRYALARAFTLAEAAEEPGTSLENARCI
jgi:hypothetical protein